MVVEPIKMQMLLSNKEVEGLSDVCLQNTVG